MMNSHTQRLLERLEKQRMELMQRVAVLTQQEYLFAAKGKWSVAQILTHLLTTESLALAYMKKKALGIQQLDNTGIVEDFKLKLLTLSQRMPLKFKAPQVIQRLTPQPMPFEILTTEWNAERQRLREFVLSIESENIRKKIFKHPIAGKFNAQQGLTVLYEHFRHHLPQVHRLIKN